MITPVLVPSADVAVSISLGLYPQLLLMCPSQELMLVKFADGSYQNQNRDAQKIMSCTNGVCTQWQEVLSGNPQASHPTLRDPLYFYLCVLPALRASENETKCE